MRFLVTLLIGGSLLPVAAAAPDEILLALASVRLEPDRAVSVSGIELDLDDAVLQIASGVLVPATPIAGRSAEFVFDGDAKFLFAPPDAIETAQLELFTGQRALDVRVRRAVLVVAGDEAAERILASTPAELPADRSAELSALFGEWLGSRERRLTGVVSALWKDALGDATQAAAAWLQSGRLGRFVYVVEPTEVESIVLGQFVPLATDDVEEYRTRKAIRREQREGRLGALRYEDIGDWDTWVSTARRSASGTTVEGREGFEPESYVLDAHIAADLERLSGRAHITLRADEPGRRAFRLRLHPDLTVGAVRLASGEKLASYREGRTLTVALPRATARDERLEIEIDYAGPALNKLDRGNFAMRSTWFWYPHAGTLDRAPYDVTLHWPKKHELLLGGNLVDSGEDGDERRERRRIPFPAPAATFEIGAFKVSEQDSDGVRLRVAVAKTDPPVDSRVMRESIETIDQAFRAFRAVFGAYPLEELTVVTVPGRSFSQGTLGLVTLTQRLMTRQNLRQRTETIAHEIAHQWWGNKVGWAGYRDQWLSEAMADYAAGIFAGYRLGSAGRYPPLARIRARARLVEEADTGQTLESLGPIVLGQRLDSSVSDEAYDAIVYEKGSLVLSTLAQVIGEEPFLHMLATLADAAAGKVIDTATFLAALERMSGRDLELPARQFVYGTGIPLVVYGYEVEHDGEDWIVRGEANMYVPRPPAFRLEVRPGGGWDVVTEPQKMTRADWSLTVPWIVRLDQKSPDDHERVIVGSTTLDGALTYFKIALREKPRDLTLDPEQSLLAVFYNRETSPQTAGRVRAQMLAKSGNGPEAEEAYRAALERPDTERRQTLTEFTESEIHFGLAELLCDWDRDAEAERHVQLGQKALPTTLRGVVRERGQWLRARLDLRAGRFREAFSRLKGTLYLRFYQREGESVVDAVRRIGFREGIVGDGRAYAMLAVAAHQSGHEEVCERATAEAERRRADMAPLVALHRD